MEPKKIVVTVDAPGRLGCPRESSGQREVRWLWSRVEFRCIIEHGCISHFIGDGKVNSVIEVNAKKCVLDHSK